MVFAIQRIGQHPHIMSVMLGVITVMTFLYLLGSVTLLLMICCICVASLRSQAQRKKKYGFHQLGHSVDIFNDSPSDSDEASDIKFLRQSTRPKMKSK